MSAYILPSPLFHLPSLAFNDQSTTLPCVGWNEAWKIATAHPNLSSSLLVNLINILTLTKVLRQPCIGFRRRHRPLKSKGVCGDEKCRVNATKNLWLTNLQLTMASQSQQIAVTDLDLPQLSDVKRQLEEVNGNLFYLRIHSADHSMIGIDPPHKLIYSAQAGAGKVQVMHWECTWGESTEYRFYQSYFWGDFYLLCARENNIGTFDQLALCPWETFRSRQRYHWHRNGLLR